MKFIILAENTKIDERCRCGHGLSIYSEVNEHTYLFDMGPDEMFAENALLLGVDLTKVEAGFLSHGHWDHGGGLDTFLSSNVCAPVYMQRSAVDNYVAHPKPDCETYIGINQDVCQRTDRIRYLDGNKNIDSIVYVFSDIRTADYLSQANSTLMRKDRGICTLDDFRHEQNYLITDGKITVLLAGCAHRGIINIMRRSEEILGRAPDYAIAGFHLQNSDTNVRQPRESIKEIAEELLAWNTVYYTGHCTGKYAFEVLKEKMGNRLKAISTGMTIELNEESNLRLP